MFLMTHGFVNEININVNYAHKNPMCNLINIAHPLFGRSNMNGLQCIIGTG